MFLSLSIISNVRSRREKKTSRQLSLEQIDHVDKKNTMSTTNLQNQGESEKNRIDTHNKPPQMNRQINLQEEEKLS